MEKEKHSSSNNTFLMLIIGVLVLAIVFVGLFILVQQSIPDTETIADEIDGVTIIDPPRLMPDFTLTDQHGEAISLSDFGGQPILITFGYTHCPDVCPLTLNEFKEIQGLLGDQAAAMRFAFISVDGERDTPEVIAQYFDVRGIEDFVGLTGAEEDLRLIGVDYGLFFERADDNEVYLVDHTAGSFLIDAEGNWIRRYNFGTEPMVLAEDLRRILAE